MTRVPPEIQEMQPGYQRRSTDGNGLKIHWPLIAWVLGIMVSALISYNVTSASYDRRISVLEDQYRRVASDISDIKTDVRTLLTR